MSLNSHDSLQGYVVYGTEGGIDSPYAIISGNEERKAACTYIPETLQNFLIEIEDRRFFGHRGIDFKALVRAAVINIKAVKVMQGGSTISQQLARNLLRNNKRTIIRKIQEAVLALQLEGKYSKSEILKKYFAEVYFGRHLYGVRSAAIYYFRKEVHNLNLSDQLSLLTLLRGPNLYSRSHQLFVKRFAVLNNLLFKRHQIDRDLQLGVKPLQMHPVAVIKPSVVSQITSNIDNHKKIIHSTLNLDIQSKVDEFIKESPYPMSIVGISSNGVFAAASTYGMEYIFNHRGNVGSTLKPFLYSYLREMGIQADDVFNSRKNELDWTVREAKKMSSIITFRNALRYSNNNAFINACTKIGMDKSLDFLTATLKLIDPRLYPSAILGATPRGLSLYELASAYHRFFCDTKDNYALESLMILYKIADDKFQFPITDIFLKTGTTNENENRLAVIGNKDQIYAISRSKNPVDDHSKDGSLISSVKRFIKKIQTPRTNYKWI